MLIFFKRVPGKDFLIKRVPGKDEEETGNGMK